MKLVQIKVCIEDDLQLLCEREMQLGDILGLFRQLDSSRVNLRGVFLVGDDLPSFDTATKVGIKQYSPLAPT